MKPEELAKLKALDAAASPPGWWWESNARCHRLYLACRRPGLGWYTVMDFVRWGLQRAQPRFWTEPRGLLAKASELSTLDHNTRMTISNPDAEIIPAARNALPLLIADAETARALLTRCQDHVPDSIFHEILGFLQGETTEVQRAE